MKRGYLTIFVLVAASLFLLLMTDVVTYVLAEKKVELSKESEATAFSAAEAGLSYYAWHLNQFPTDMQDGTGQDGTYTHDVAGPTGTSTASFTLTLSPQYACGQLMSVLATSVGVAANGASSPITLSARLANPSVFATSTPDFAALASELASLKNIASTSGAYVPPSGAYGYSIVFNADGSFTSAPVTDATQVWGFSAAGGWAQEYSVMKTTGSTTSHSIPSSCPLVFVADNAWVSGVVSGKILFVAAGLSSPDKNIYLPANLTYADPWGDALTALAEGSVLITLDSPDILSLQGGFIAAKGVFGRNEYLANGTHAVPEVFSSDVRRSTLTIFGAGISGVATTTKWSDSDDNFTSGYVSRIDGTDRALIEEPPALTPTTTASFMVTDWRQN